MLTRTPPPAVHAPSSKRTLVEDDVGLAAVKDGVVQHSYVGLADDTLEAINRTPGIKDLFSLEARANAKQGGGWNNDIATFRNGYLELLPVEFAGKPGTMGAAVAVQSEASKASFAANLAKLFGANIDNSTFQLDVKNNAQPGDLTGSFEPYSRVLEQWSATTEKDGTTPVFAGDYFGAWGTTEQVPRSGKIETVKQTVKRAFNPNGRVSHIQSEQGVLAPADAADYAKLLAAGGFKLELSGLPEGAATPKLSELKAYFEAQKAAGASVRMTATSPQRGAMKVIVDVNDDVTQQGFKTQRYGLKQPAPRDVNRSFGNATDGVLTFTMKKGEGHATLTYTRPTEQPAPVPAPAPAAK